MSKYFLIKERNYCKIDGGFRGQDRKLLGSYDDYNEAIKNASQFPGEEGYKKPQDETLIYVVKVVAKCFANLNSFENCKEEQNIQKIQVTKVCEECGWPEHEGRCGIEALQK